MPRSPRMQLQSGWHHVTNRGIDRRNVFRSIDDRLDFGRMIDSGHGDLGITVPDTRAALIERLSPSSPDALQQAVWRSRRLARSEPWLLRAADEALALLSSCV